jgi:Tol biopolymer transport system component
LLEKGCWVFILLSGQLTTAKRETLMDSFIQHKAKLTFSTQSRRKTAKSVAWGCLALFFCLAQPSLFAAETTRISVASGGGQGIGSSYSGVISADGRFVAFSSSASNLVPGDNNGYDDCFVRDRLTEQNSLVSVTTAGVQGNNMSGCDSISADGRFVAFWSEASNLVVGDTNRVPDIFVRDRLTGQTTRISVATGGGQGNDWSVDGMISADGRFVAFASAASTFLAGDTNHFWDIFIHDRLTRQTTLISANRSIYVEKTGTGDLPSMSADGRFVAFASFRDLAAEDTNFNGDIYVNDRQSGQTTRVSVATGGGQGNGFSDYPHINADGRFVAFQSNASNLVAGDTNGLDDIFVHDRKTGQTTRVSIATGGVQGNGLSSDSSISADGRFVVFRSLASNLVAGDTNGIEDIFVRDRLTGQTNRVSLGTDGGQGNNLSQNPTISADGRFVSFMSYANNLVIDDTNFGPDTFVRDRFLNKSFKADLKISVTQKPVSIPKNGQGTFLYTIINNGPATITSVRIQHTFSNGQIVALTPSQVSCTRYSLISLCNLGSLASGASLVLQANLKALRNPLRQYLSLASNGPADPVPANNFLNISTTVTP